MNPPHQATLRCCDSEGTVVRCAWKVSYWTELFGGAGISSNASQFWMRLLFNWKWKSEIRVLEGFSPCVRYCLHQGFAYKTLSL
jgi:hypothetical protein